MVSNNLLWPVDSTFITAILQLVKINRHDIAIIIPCYNEQQIITQVVKDLLLNDYSNIIVVDDGSVTPVSSVLQQLPVICLRHTVNLGQGAAIQTGLAYANLHHAQYAVTFDADGQHQSEDIEKLITPLISGVADVALGSRFLTQQASGIPPVRRTVLHLARFINFCFSGLLLSDAHNGLRAFNQKAMNTIVITENRMAHASELLLEFKAHQLTVTEVPVKILYTSYSRNKGQHSSDGIKILFDLVLHKLFR